MCVPLEITGILSDCDDSSSFSAGGMRPSRKRMSTKLCALVEARSDQPGAPACLSCCPSCYSTSSCKVLVSSAEVHGPSSLSIDRFAVLHFGTLTFGGVNIWSWGGLNPVSLGFSLRLACGTAFTSVRISISVYAFVITVSKRNHRVPHRRPQCDHLGGHRVIPQYSNTAGFIML